MPAHGRTYLAFYSPHLTPQNNLPCLPSTTGHDSTAAMDVAFVSQSFYLESEVDAARRAAAAVELEDNATKDLRAMLGPSAFALDDGPSALYSDDGGRRPLRSRPLLVAEEGPRGEATDDHRHRNPHPPAPAPLLLPLSCGSTGAVAFHVARGLVRPEDVAGVLSWRGRAIARGRWDVSGDPVDGLPVHAVTVVGSSSRNDGSGSIAKKTKKEEEEEGGRGGRGGAGGSGDGSSSPSQSASDGMLMMRSSQRHVLVHEPEVLEALAPLVEALGRHILENLWDGSEAEDIEQPARLRPADVFINRCETARQ